MASTTGATRAPRRTLTRTGVVGNGNRTGLTTTARGHQVGKHPGRDWYITPTIAVLLLFVVVGFRTVVVVFDSIVGCYVIVPKVLRGIGNF